MASEDKQRKRTLDLIPSRFFALRTPLLPAGELSQWSDGLTATPLSVQSDESTFEAAWKKDVEMLRERLREIIARPEIVHALYVASPTLQSGIEYWKRNPDSKKGLQAQRALVRYFARMAARPTPFGLFSGCSIGEIDESQTTSALILEQQSKYRLSCRLDFDYLFALTDVLRRDPQVEVELRYRPNTSLHKIADAWHYIESRISETKRTHHLVKVESDAYIEAVIDRARGGATISQLVETVLTTQGGAEPTEDEAREYVLGLIRDNDILVSDLSPLLTGTPPLDDVIEHLETISSGAQIAQTLRGVRDNLCSIEKTGLGCSPADYSTITTELEKLPAKFELAHLYQVDMIKPVQSAVLGKSVIAELMRGIETLCVLGQTNEPEDLKTFREAFSARYEQAMVPLLDALDEESGIGFGSAAMRTDASPLLRGLRLNGAGEADWKSRRLGIHPMLFSQAMDCIRSGKNELELDCSELKNDDENYAKVADAFCAMATLVAASADAIEQGDFEFHLHGAFGPSGARLLGRFCHEDPLIETAVREHLRQEEMHDPEAIYAEVVYLPEGRIGNVLCRPVLREYEIPYLGRSGAPPDKQLPVDDLLVGIHQGSIALFSRRLGRRVVPRVTNAHGFMNPQLSSVYRFLCYLQHQNGKSVPGFSWGALDSLDYLPRVRVGKIILGLARWQLSEKEVEEVGKDDGSRRFAAVQKLRRQRDLPRWIVLQEGDNSLPVDLDNALSVDAFVHVLKRGKQAVVTEMYPSSDRLCVSSAQGLFYHELNIPFVRKREVREAQPSVVASAEVNRNSVPGLAASGIGRESRHLSPGSEWTFVKLYGGSGALDDVLTTAVRPLMQRAMESGNVSRWFFIRYADPQDHLRIRFHGPESQAQMLSWVHEAFDPLMISGKLWKIELDTYQREIERYGGMEGLLVAEDLFYADSEAVVDILQQLAGDEGLDIRWRTGIMGVDRLLSDFRLDDETKRATVERWRERLQNDFKVDAAGKKQLAERFRTVRGKLTPLLDASSEAADSLHFARDAFDRRSMRNAAAIEKLRSLESAGRLTAGIPELLSSYSHMHINRLIRASQVAHEFVLYDFLFELYDGRLARKMKEKVRAIA
jgi:lantibiotic biosynthesis protein